MCGTAASLGWSPVPTDPKTFGHEGAVWGLCFDPKNGVLTSTNQGEGGKVRIKQWRTTDWALLRQTPPLQDSIYALVCRSGRHARIVTGDSKARVTVRNATDLSLIASTINVTRGEVNVWSLALADDPHAILSGNSDGHVYRWVPDDRGWPGFVKSSNDSFFDCDPSVAEKDCRTVVNPTINSVAFDRKYGWVAAGGVGRSVEIYDSKNRRPLYSLSGHDGTIWWVTFDPQGTRLAYGGLDGIVRVVDLVVLQRLDTDSPASLYQSAQDETGLSIDDSGQIVRVK